MAHKFEKEECFVNISIITLMELPYNNVQTIREMHDASIIWYCENAETTQKDFEVEIKDLQ